MNPFTARTIFAATSVLLLSLDGTALRAQNVAAPPPVAWPTPPPPEGPIFLQSAEVRDFRATVLSRTLEQPWSVAFLPTGGEPLLRELKQRIRDVRQGPDGLLHVLTSENPGALIRLEPAGAPGTAATR